MPQRTPTPTSRTPGAEPVKVRAKAARAPDAKPSSAGTTAPAPDAVLQQAQRDLDAGMVDSDMRATPGLDAQRRAKLVPGAGGKPPTGD